MIGRIRVWLVLYQQRLPSGLRLSMVILWAALLWILSSRPGSGDPGGWLRGIVWNSGHIVAFGVLAGLIMLSLQGNIVVRFRLAVAGSVFYGAVDEFHQGCVPGRAMDIWDLCSDGLGAALFGCGIWWLLTGNRRPRAWILPLAFLGLCSVSMAA